MRELKITEKARKEIRRHFSARNSVNTLKTDPELTEIFDNFAFDESLTPTEGLVVDKTRVMCILACTIGCNAQKSFSNYVDACLNLGVKPREIREIVYQAVPYIGFSRVMCFIQKMNEAFENLDIKLPLDDQSTVTPETRFEKGKEIVDQIYGEGTVDNLLETAPKGQENITRFMVNYCYGDFYSRNGIDLQHRELITFCFLASMGGFPKQLVNHAKGNKSAGTSKSEMVAAVMAMLPHIGFPRALQAIEAINAAYAHQF